jgi:ATP-binding protein involved in chromosome partitioning
MVSHDEVLAALGEVIDPELRKPVTELDMVRDVAIDGSHVTVTIALTVAGCPLRTSFQDQVHATVGRLEGVESVSLEFDVMTPEEKTALTQKLRGGIAQRTKGISLDRSTRVIAVASGKGGVGKSTVATNLALALSALGARVGLMDADVYGPSIPLMLGVTEKARSGHGARLQPVERHGISMISMGMFVSEGTPIIWRGPMLTKLIVEFLRNCDWGELDVLVMDLPPGTGDVQLTLTQQVPITGGVIVTTPQDVALADVRRGIEMFRQMHAPVLGVIENMSYHLCPGCGTRAELFGHGGGAAMARDFGVPFLGEVPLARDVCEAGDRGLPIVAAAPSSPQSRAFHEIAERVLVRLKDAERRAAAAAVSPPS